MPTHNRISAINAHRRWFKVCVRIARRKALQRQRLPASNTIMVDKSTQTSSWPDEHGGTSTSPEPTHLNTSGPSSTDVAPTNPTPAPFMTLPLELRRQIYLYHLSNTNEPYHHSLPPILYSSLQISHEISDITDRILTFQLYNGSCPSWRTKLFMSNEAASRVSFLWDKFQGKNLKLRIELQCGHSSVLVGGQLDMLMLVIREKKMPEVEVCMTSGRGCRACAEVVWYGGGDPLEPVKEMVERAERWRDQGVVRCSVQPRCNGRCRTV